MRKKCFYFGLLIFLFSCTGTEVGNPQMGKSDKSPEEGPSEIAASPSPTPTAATSSTPTPASTPGSTETPNPLPTPKSTETPSPITDLPPLIIQPVITKPVTGKGKTEFASKNTLTPSQNNGQSFYEEKTLSESDAVDLSTPIPASLPSEVGAINNASITPPAGRIADVEEADIYKKIDNTLFVLNTYKGLMVFDLSDPKNPLLISRFNVFGSPIEMFIENNRAILLINEALDLKIKEGGNLEFVKLHTSQIVSLDIADLKDIKKLQTLNVKGNIWEGVSRKIENILYMVSRERANYWWGWDYMRPQTQAEEAVYLYSYNLTDPINIQPINKLNILQNPLEKENYYYYPDWSNVIISATANTLMVAQNYQERYDSIQPTVIKEPYFNSCYDYKDQKVSQISIIDISSPQGEMTVYSQFQVEGMINDQFKQDYRLIDGKAYYLGVTRNQKSEYQQCQSFSETNNIVYAVDVTNKNEIKIASQLSIGKPNETVKASLFRSDGILFAITSRQRDPVYVIDTRNPLEIKVLSEIDNLSGDINLFRNIENNKFLLAIGTDNSSTCKGFNTDSWWGARQVAVSIIDVQNLENAKLVQRECVQIRWGWSDINFNLDQAHKMIGLFDGEIENILSLPVQGWVTSDKDSNYPYGHYATTVGLLTWDLTNYDPNIKETEQDVLKNRGIIFHPEGTVRRTIVSKINDQKYLINLSDLNLSLVNLEDIDHPRIDSSLVLAENEIKVYALGNYLLKKINISTQGNNYYYEYRIIDPLNNNVVSRFGAEDKYFAQEILKDNLLILITSITNYNYYTYQNTGKTTFVIWDLSNPENPVKKSPFEYDAILQMNNYNYYYYPRCGSCEMYIPYFYNYINNIFVSKDGLYFIYTETLRAGRVNQQSTKIIFLNLSDPDLPEFSTPYDLEKEITFVKAMADKTSNVLYLNYNKPATNEENIRLYQYFLRELNLNESKKIIAAADINIPGTLIKTFTKGEETIFITTEYISEEDVSASVFYLLHKITKDIGETAAELLDEIWLKDRTVSYNNYVVSEDKIILTYQPSYYFLRYKYGDNWGKYNKDNLMIIDFAELKFSTAMDKEISTQGLNIVSFYKGNLLANISGLGFMVLSIEDLTNIKPINFVNTNYYADDFVILQDKLYLPAGFYGTYVLDLINGTPLPIYKE